MVKPLTVEVATFGEALESVTAIAPLETWQPWIQTWLTHLAPDISPIGAYELSLQFTTDATIQQLNREYRQRDRATDVLSFAALDATPLPPVVWQHIPCNLGDVIVSVETAQRQAIDSHHTFKEELAWLVAHGVLHLLGWDHPDETQLQAMWQKQRSLLELIDLPLQHSAYFSVGPVNSGFS
jgi:probable rRNA maturation factor